MNDLDREIQQALDAEERELFEQLGEQGIFTQWFSVYRGKQAWIAIVSTFVMFILFGGAVYAGWNFFQSSSGVEAAQWGAAVWFLMTMVGFLKLWFWMRMESNRVLREVKRVELQIARLQPK
jgi:uncharacterized protein DUF6768